MTASPADLDRHHLTDRTNTEFAAIAAWLDAPAPPHAAGALSALLGHLTILRAGGATQAPFGALVDRLYERTILLERTLLPALTERSLPIPIPRKTRPMLRQLQEVLLALADVLLAATGEPAAGPGAGPATDSGSGIDVGKALWRSVHVLGQHLLIGHLAGSPAGKGVWQQLHRTYATAERRQLTQAQGDGAAWSLQDVYFSAVLLGCAQPASFTSQEIEFIANCLQRLVKQIDCSKTTTPDDPAAFWIDAARDAPAIARSRMPAPPDTDVRVFSCTPIIATLREILDKLEAGSAADALGLPVFAKGAAGRGVLRRLILYWGAPGKRRFSRRHQNDRALLCCGLTTLWRLFRDGSGAAVETSNWMIINESPDGSAIRHVSGKTGELAVGDVTAIRSESAQGDQRWQTCIVRWALSENQEHLELGLQILSVQALPAILAQPAKGDERARLPVLILPGIGALRADEWLVAPAGELTALPASADIFVLVVEKDNIEIREAQATRLEEQNGLVEIFAIERVNRSE